MATLRLGPLLHRPKRFGPLLGLVLAGICGVAEPAQAATCTISAVPIAFGSYNPVTQAAVNTTATITTTCTSLLVAGSYSISIGSGQSGTPTARYLLSNSNRLNYQIYVNAARTQVAGDGTAGTATVSGSITPLVGLLVVTRTDTLYATIPGGQLAAPGTYSDTLILQLTY